MKINKLLIPTFLEEAKMYLHGDVVIIGGGTFLHLGYKDAEIKTAMSLSKLNLDFIKYKDDVVELGPTVTLHQMETEQKLNEMYDNIFKKAFAHIVGVQFRNIATIGGSIAARLGYSEPITILLVLDAMVELKGMTKLELEDYLSNTSYKKDLITKIIIPMDNVKVSYRTIRNTQTDIPALILAVSKDKDQKIKIAIGARPAVAKIARKASDFLSAQAAITGDIIEKAMDLLMQEMDFGNDIRADKDYRISVVKSLIPEMIKEVTK